MIADQAENFRILQKQKNIDDEIREKFEVENTSLKEKLINTQKKLKGANKQIEEFNKKVEKIEFLELNLLYGHKCRKTFYNKLYKPGSPEYKKCVLAKGKVN